MHNAQCKTANILKLNFNFEHLFTSKNGKEIWYCSRMKHMQWENKNMFFVIVLVFVSQMNQSIRCSSATNQATSFIKDTFEMAKTNERRNK